MVRGGEDKCDRDEQFYICIYVRVSVYACVRVHSACTRILNYTHLRTRQSVQQRRAYYYKCYNERLSKLLLLLIITAVDHVATARPPIVDDL